MKAKNWMNTSPSNGRTMFGPSQTIPDQTMSIREIMNRYVKGIPIENGKEPIYMEDDNQIGLNPRKLDLVDIQAMKLDNADNIVKLEERREKEQKENEEKRKKKQEDEFALLRKKLKEAEEIPEGH